MTEKEYIDLSVKVLLRSAMGILREANGYGTLSDEAVKAIKAISIECDGIGVSDDSPTS